MMDGHSAGSLGTAHRRLEQIMVLERALRHDARDILRSVSTALVLAGLGSVLSSDGGIAGGATQDLYELSRPCETLDYFVSHSWRQGRWIKLFALCKHLHWAFAFALSVVALVVSAAAYFTWAPDTLCTDRQPASVYIRASAVVVVPGVVFAVAMFLGHRVPFLQADCFVDKLCIHQTDDRLKAKAIDSFDLYLRFSRRMIVLWSPPYMTRIWCVYELSLIHI